MRRLGAIVILAHAATTSAVAAPHGSLTLLAAVLLGGIAAVLVSVAVLDQRGRLAPRTARVVFREWAPSVLATARWMPPAATDAVAGEHAREDLLTGAAFIAAGVLQVAWAVAYLARPGRMLAVAGLALQGAILAGWAVSRTVGLPFGAHAGIPEAVGVTDAAASAFQALVVAGLLVTMVGPAAIRSRLTVDVAGAWALRGSSVVVIAVLAVAALAAAGLTPGMGTATRLADGD